MKCSPYLHHLGPHCTTSKLRLVSSGHVPLISVSWASSSPSAPTGPRGRLRRHFSSRNVSVRSEPFPRRSSFCSTVTCSRHPDRHRR
eukprot:745616-Hanusia_phi.AAC.1